ncbi:MAG: phosphoribosylaminoimidazolesuccinocarboxamide synthase [Desulfatibacillaceae bacterium]|nr:phosphoribosylaminoimidazolesuccinocarboxamide synthase [Desulfatibacillaceae bacterium]
MSSAIFETHFPDLPAPKRGKVRDMYDLGDAMLMVASDRLSAFDVVMPNPVPDKGKVLTQISLFWFGIMEGLVENHIITSDVSKYPAVCKPYADALAGRSILVKKAKPLAVECVVRGYITGSGWKDYQKTGSVCGIKLPEGLKESEKLPQALFTPSTKAEQGLHDENISFEEAARIVGQKVAEQIRDLSLAIYERGVALADSKGIIIADTKFEFGILEGKLILIDEVLTPDSSRFWPRETYKVGQGQESFDKQFVRDYLLGIKWGKKPPAPVLPEDVVAKTREKYIQALERLTGQRYGL